MTLAFDHAIIVVHDLDAAIRDYESLGFTVKRGGVHIDRITHNALIVFLDGTYLELLAPTGEVPATGMVAGEEGLIGYALRCDDIEAEVARLKSEGFDVGDVTPGGRTRADGMRIEWKVALIDGNLAPFLIQDVTPRELRIATDPALTTHANRAIGTKGVDIVVRSMSLLGNYYERLFNELRDQTVINDWRIGSITLHELQLERAQTTLEYFLNNFKTPATNFHHWVEREQTFADVLGERDKLLHAIHLVCEAGKDDRLVPEYTHQVRWIQHIGVPPTRGSDILVGLDDVNWGALEHGAGQATDMPGLLRALTSDDSDVSNNALNELHVRVNHQGAIFNASVEIMPFLQQLIEAVEDEIKIEIFELLEPILWGTPMSADNQLAARRDQYFRAGIPTYQTYLNHPNTKLRETVARLLSTYAPTE